MSMDVWTTEAAANATEKHDSWVASIEARRNKTEECNMQQTGFETAVCEWVDGFAAACDAYSDCYKPAVNAHARISEDAQQTEMAGKADYASAVQIQCQLEVMNATDIEEKHRLLAGCSAAPQANTSHLSPTYPAVPAERECDAAAAPRPCRPGWEAEAYTNKPWYAAAPTRVCTPCRTPHYYLDFQGSGTEIADADASELEYTVIGSASVSDERSKSGSTSLHCGGGGVGLEGLAFGSGDFVVEFWAMLESSSSVHDGLFTTATISSADRFDPNKTGVVVALDDTWIGTGSSHCQVQRTLDLQPLQWHHIRVQRIRGNFSLYRDGALLGEVACTATLGHARAEVCNRYVGSNRWRFQGWIDSLNITVLHQ